MTGDPSHPLVSTHEHSTPVVVSQDDPVHTKGEGWERQAKRTRDYFHSPGSTPIEEESLWEKQVTVSVPQLYCSDTEFLPSGEGRPLVWRAPQVCPRELTLFGTKLGQIRA